MADTARYNKLIGLSKMFIKSKGSSRPRAPGIDCSGHLLEVNRVVARNLNWQLADILVDFDEVHRRIISIDLMHTGHGIGSGV
jgi:hypothetical protein